MSSSLSPLLPRLAAATTLAFGLAAPVELRAEAAPPAEAAAGPAKEPSAAESELCSLIESAAAAHDLPVAFFTRLLWKESRFRSDAVSPKGAQGIAQFMPGTAAERGLLDPFDPHTAIPASAGLLADLSARFGNLGLAAAAYNAGAQRVTDWLTDASTLPWETQDYVASITGVAAEAWADPEAAAELPAEMREQDCLTLAALLKVPGNSIGPSIATSTAPWGVQVAGNFSRTRALSAYQAVQKRFRKVVGDRPPIVIGARAPSRGNRAFYRVRVPAESRKEADRLCADLKAAGGSCIVLKT
jgi:hypothetical protein